MRIKHKHKYLSINLINNCIAWVITTAPAQILFSHHALLSTNIIDILQLRELNIQC